MKSHSKKKRSLKKIQPPAKNKKIGRPKKNSGYAEKQPVPFSKSK